MRCGTLALCLLSAWIQTLDVARAENAARKNAIPVAAERGFVATKGSVDLQSATADDGYVSSPTSKTASEMEPDGAVEAPRADEDPSKANVLASTNAARPHASEL